MNKHKENEKKRKRMGVLFSILFGIMVIGLIYSFKFDIPKQEPVKLIELDYTGGGESGGSSAPSESEDNSEGAADQVKTQEDESPVKKTTSKEKSTSKSNSTSSSSSSTKKTNSKAVAGAGTFGNNNGTGSGNNDGDGDGFGNGQGPGVGDKIGDGSGRTIRYKPSADNPIDEEGTVVVEILIDRTGKVTSATVLSNHSRTTTSNPTHYAEAKKTAMQYKFNSKSDASLYEKRTVAITFKLQ